MRRRRFVRYHNGKAPLAPCFPLRTAQYQPQSVYWKPFYPPGTQRYGLPTKSSYCSSSESSGQLLSRHLLPRYLKPHFSSPLRCLPLSTFLPSPKTFKTGIRQSNWHLFLVSLRPLVWSAATLTPSHLTFLSLRSSLRFASQFSVSLLNHHLIPYHRLIFLRLRPVCRLWLLTRTPRTALTGTRCPSPSLAQPSTTSTWTRPTPPVSSLETTIT